MSLDYIRKCPEPTPPPVLIRELTYAAAHDKCIADEMVGKGNIEHMGDSANSEAEKVQLMSILEVTWTRTAKGQTSANHVEVFSTGVNRVDSKMPHRCQKKKSYTPDTPINAAEDVAFGLYRTGT